MPIAPHTVGVAAQVTIPADAVLPVIAEIMRRYPPNSIDSVDRADTAIVEVARLRTAVQSQWSGSEQACLSAFFATRCLDSARERRRIALESLRPIELEANAFKRRARVLQRDQALDHKKAKVVQQDQSADQQNGSTQKAVPAPKVPDHAASNHVTVSPRGQKKQMRSSVIDSETEARNHVAFDKKVLESAQRQREIVEKKAEKERNRAAKKAANAV